MHYRILGHSGLRISEVGFGAWQTGADGVWRDVTDEQSIEALHYAFDHGVNFVDTANLYGAGHSEEIIGQVLKERTEEIYIASKVGFDTEHTEGAIMHPTQNYPQNYTKAAVVHECEKSLRRLGIEAIHLYQLHCPPLFVIQEGEIFDILEDLKKDGKIVSYGVSVETCEEALAAMMYPGVTALQIIFNLFRFKPAREVFPAASGKDVGILARVPLASGLLAGKITKETQFNQSDHRSWEKKIYGETYAGVDLEKGLEAVEELRPVLMEKHKTMVEGALRWILDFDAVTTVIPGIKNKQQAVENIAASDSQSFTEKEMDALEAVYKTHFASDFDLKF